MSDDRSALPDSISTERLRLRVLTTDDVAALAGGRRRPGWHDEFPRDDDVDAASFAGADGWGPRLVVSVADELVIGSIGFTGPPVTVAGIPETEIGYGLVPAVRRAGLATEAVAAMVAAADGLSVRVRATVEVDNVASRRVLERCGFALAGRTADGLVLMRRDRPR